MDQLRSLDDSSHVVLSPHNSKQSSIITGVAAPQKECTLSTNVVNMFISQETENFASAMRQVTEQAKKSNVSVKTNSTVSQPLR